MAKSKRKPAFAGSSKPVTRSNGNGCPSVNTKTSANASSRKDSDQLDGESSGNGKASADNGRKLFDDEISSSSPFVGNNADISSPTQSSNLGASSSSPKNSDSFAENSPPGVRLNASQISTSPAANAENRPPGVCINASQNFSTPATQKSALNGNAQSFLPGSIDSLLNLMNPNACPTHNREVPISTPIPASSASIPNAQFPLPGSNCDVLPEARKPVSAFLPKHTWGGRKPTPFCLHDDNATDFLNDGVVTVDEVEAAEIKEKFSNALVGRVFGRNFHFEWLEKQLQQKWGGIVGFSARNLGEGCFMLMFGDRVSRDAVWLGGPYHIAGYAVGLDLWSEQFVPSMNPVLLAPCWIRFPGLPIHLWGERNLWRFATQIGEPICIDAATATMERTTYARICVRRCLSKPVIGGIRIRSNATGEFFQRVTYEGFASLCTKCGLAGHTVDDCVEVQCQGPAPAPIGNGLDDWTMVPPRKPPGKAVWKKLEKQAVAEPAAVSSKPIAQPAELNTTEHSLEGDKEETVIDKGKGLMHVDDPSRKSRARWRSRPRYASRGKYRSKSIVGANGNAADLAGSSPLHP